MKSVARMELKPGMELGEAVYSHQNKLLFPENTVLTDLFIKKLERYSIMCVTVLEPVDYASTYFERIRLAKDYPHFEQVYTNNLNAYKFMLEDFLTKGLPLNANYLLQIHDNIRSCTKSGYQLLDMLYYMVPVEDNITYAHCLNSALISNVFAGWLSLSAADTKTLTLCGFFYDIGKLLLPNELLWTTQRLTEEQFAKIKTHTTLGYDLLKRKNVTGEVINQHIINATLMHHERCDGSGYPNHLVGDDIDIFAKYISIVDSYEAMSSPRLYRPSPLNPFQVIQGFENSGLNAYDYASVSNILSHLAKDQIGSQVALSTGEHADIIMINQQMLSRPLVKLEKSGEFVDLKEHPELTITAML